jgi:hypothetical protein
MPTFEGGAQPSASLNRARARGGRSVDRAKAAAPAGCYGSEIWYKVEVEKDDDARTSLCHCGNCNLARRLHS